MIQATSKGESYIKRIEVPESKDEGLLKDIVDMGVPVSVLELSRMSKMSTNRVTGIVKNLRRAGMVEIEPDSFAGKAAAGVLKGIKRAAASPRSVDGAKVQRIVLGNPDTVFGTRKTSQEEKEVLEGRR